MTRRAWGLGAASLLVLALAALAYFLPSLGAGGLLHPARRPVAGAPPPTCENAAFEGEGVGLKGWDCRTPVVRRGTLVYLHGIADNRMSAAGIIERFETHGLDVVAYDSRAHGDSDGPACTYGFYEKKDLSRVLDAIPRGPIILVGTSLGAAVALQAAAVDTRITGVVAAEVFSDLMTVVRERAPFVFTTGLIRRAIDLAEEQGRFQAGEVSPVVAARKVRVPVLLIHGEADVDTPPDHSRRVLTALPGQKRLIIVPGARHNQSLRGDVWNEIEEWVETVVATAPGP